MKDLTVGVTCALVFSLVPLHAAGDALPDELTVNVGDVENAGTNVTLVLTKRSMRSANYLCGIWTDEGFKKVTFPVSTYRGYVQDDPLMQVNGNIEPGGILNANFTENRMIVGRVRGLKITVPKGKCTPTMSTGNKVVPLKSLRKRRVPTPGGYLIPEVPMRQSRWCLRIPKTYTEQFEMEKVVSQVEQRWNDGDFIFARDVGTAWEIDILVLEDPKSTKPMDWNVVCAGNPDRRKECLYGGVSGVPGRNHGKIDSLFVTGLFHEAGILLHEAAHLYDNWCHQLDVNDGLCGGGAYWAYNNVALLVENRKARYNETNFPGVIYGSALPPHAMYDFANTRKDTPVTIDVLENDYDGNGDALSLQAVVPKSEKGGTVVVSKDGKVVYTPAPGFVGADKFTYTVVDGTGVGNRSGQVKVDVRAEGLAVHYDFEEVEAERLEDRRNIVPIDSELWFYDRYDKRPTEEKLLYHFRNLGPYDAGPGTAPWLKYHAIIPVRDKGELKPLPGPYATGRGTAHWIKYFPVKGVRGKGLWNPGPLRNATGMLGDGGDPGRGSLSASVWVLYPPASTGGGHVILCKGGAPFNFVNGWAISGGSIGGKFGFSGNVTRMLQNETFSLTSEETIEPNKWYHLVMVMDREKKQLRAWVNNKEVKTPDAKVSIPDGVIEYYGPLHLFNSYTGKWWKGTRALVDEVKIFTSVLTPKQVAALYAEGQDAKVPDLKAE